MPSSAQLSFLFTAVCVSAPVFANGKAEIRDRMLAIDSEILALRANGGAPNAIARLQREYAELSERLGGGRVLAPRTHADTTWSESLAHPPLYVITPLPPGSSSTTTSFTGTGGPLPDVTTVQFS